MLQCGAPLKTDTFNTLAMLYNNPYPEARTCIISICKFWLNAKKTPDDFKEFLDDFAQASVGLDLNEFVRIAQL